MTLENVTLIDALLIWAAIVAYQAIGYTLKRWLFGDGRVEPALDIVWPFSIPMAVVAKKWRERETS